MKRLWLILFGDFTAFWVSFLIILRMRFTPIEYSHAFTSHIAPFLVLYVSWTLIFFLFGLYDLFTIKPTIPHIRRFVLALVTAFVIGIFLFYFVAIFGISPKTNLVFQILGFGILSFAFRRMVYGLFSTQIVRPVILVGNSDDLSTLHEALKKNPQLGLKILACTENLQDSLKTYASIKNTVFIVEGTIKRMTEEDIVHIYRNTTEILSITDAYERYLYKIPVSHISQSWFIQKITAKIDFMYTIATQIISTFCALIVLLLASPILLISALFVYLHDRGPIFYTQERVGLHGKRFQLYKLRSMIIESEKNGAVWAQASDSRITPIGKILRKLHIDEIPQMFNILKGDLALVGPRPERPEFVTLLEKTIPHYTLRHIIKPGFTGWAQIKYHYAQSIDESKEKFEYDLYYIKNRNIFLDFGIILRTIQIIFTH